MSEIKREPLYNRYGQFDGMKQIRPGDNREARADALYAAAMITDFELSKFEDTDELRTKRIIKIAKLLECYIATGE